MTKLSARLPVSVFKEGKHFVAYTQALDLSTSKKGTTEEVLLGLGWEKAKKHLTPPSLIAQESKQIEFAVR